ncbi:MAG: DUF1800 family protein [Dokdonella sp.]
MIDSEQFRGRVFLNGMLLFAGLFALLPAPQGHAQGLSHWPDASFHDSFDGITSGPATDADASRFLAQATFGASANDITHVRLLGYEGWLNEQFSAPVSTQVAYIDWVEAGGQQYISDAARLEIWAINSAATPDPSRGNAIPTDQLRQRVAFALSEIFVVSNSNGTLANQPWALASFYDLLATDAFVNYRSLLEDVTKHPTMGIYLSMIGNQKADPSQNMHPDENYAREVNQLFSVGLVQLNLDGSAKLAGGQPIPTYNQAAVRGFAAVFTGWIWNNAGCGETTYTCCNEDTFSWCGPSSSDDLPWRKPMQAVEAYHDNTSNKQLLDYPGVALANGLLVHGADAQGEMSAALDNIFRHPNVGPFVAIRLIQRLVTSNPTPAYVQRVAQTFNDDGSAQHVRGNLRAVVRAILLDPEARYGQWQRADTFGKLREPLLKSTQMWRAMAARSASGRIAALSTWPPIEDWYGQAPQRSPTVFNFFKPDFSRPGEVTQRGLHSPEFQILGDTMVVATPNNLFHQIFCYYVGSTRCWDSDDPDTLQMNYSADAALAATHPAALIDEYDTLLMAGQMSPFMRNVLLTRLSALDASDYGSSLGQVRVQHALYLIMNSPEYSIQK